MNEPSKPGRRLSIGALARATGVPAETLRTWERRYGFPEPERTSTGHRRYTLETLERVRMVHGTRAGRQSLFQFDPQPVLEMKEYLEMVSSQWDGALARLKSFVENEPR